MCSSTTARPTASTERSKGRGVYRAARRGEAHEPRYDRRGRPAPARIRGCAHRAREPATARFDWDAKSLTLQFRARAATRPLPAHAQDRLSFLFDFAFQAPGNRPVEFNVVDGKGIADYVFDVAGRERIKVPAGEFEALRLAQRKENAGDSSIEVWLDPARSYLPLRVLVVQKDGTRIDQVATRVTLAVIVYRAQLARAETLLAELLLVLRARRRSRCRGTSGRIATSASRTARSSRKPCTRCCAADARSRPQRSPPRRASLRSPRWCACTGSPAARSRACCARARKRWSRACAPAKTDAFPPAVRADLPDWLWERLAALHGEAEAMRIAQGMLNPAPLDLRVNLAKLGRDEVLERLRASGIAAQPTPHSPAGHPARGQARDQPASAFHRRRGRGAGRRQPAARLAARAAARRDGRRLSAPAQAARRSHSRC